MKTQEIWKDIDGFEGVYQVSNLGRIKSFKKEKSGRLLSIKNKVENYPSVVLIIGKNKKSLKLHKIVAEAFLVKKPNSQCVNHKDFNKHNNKASNLEWCTFKENMHHAIIGKPQILAKMNKYNIDRAFKVTQKSMEGEIIKVFNSSKEAAEETGICRRNILQVARKEEYKKGLIRKQAGGYIWEICS